MTPRSKRFTMQIIPFGAVWLVFGLIYALIEKGILGDSTHYPSTGTPYDCSSGLASTLVLATCTGLMVGVFEVRYLNRLFARRSFMFLDMKSSTMFAEKLGHVRYFEMLKVYYADLSDPIIDHAAEIYQYVGDEIVLSWTVDTGLRNNNCIQCFFVMRAALARQAGKYQRTYGVVPTFKAGPHCGRVTTGEIGVIKKDIIFTGDVLNTTARIQGLCNDQGVDILVSEQLVKKLAPDPSLQIRVLGQSALRGRDEKVVLFTLGRS